VSEETGADFFVATPYHSSKRGLNDHTNDLMREDFANGTDICKGSDVAAQTIQSRLNARPGKVPRHLTPIKVLHRAQSP